MANINIVERLLCERYNVGSLDGLGALARAVQAARTGDLAPLTQALDGRELYRWRAPIEAALAEPDDPPAAVDAPPHVATAATPEPVSEFDAPEAAPEEDAPAPRPRGRRRNESPRRTNVVKKEAPDGARSTQERLDQGQALLQEEG